MKIGVVLLCRYTSRRLPGKILCDINGKPVLTFIAERICRATPRTPIVVATSDDPSDDRIAQLCHLEGLECFRGSLHNVANRFLTAAQTNGFDFAVRINGDNVLVDGNMLQRMIEIAKTGLYDFITNVPGRTFPYGMSLEILRTSFYAAHEKQMLGEADREHVTLYFYNHRDVGKRFVFRNTACPDMAGFPLALDTEEDLRRIREIVSHLPWPPEAAGISEIAGWMRHKGAISPAICEIECN